MSERKIRVGLIGCGKIARRHAHALDVLPEAEFVACCDRDEARARATAEEYGVTSVWSDADALLQSGDVEAVLVCTPHPAHEVIVVAAARAGVHALCEKPITVSLTAADNMVDAHDVSGTQFGVIFQRRFWPAAQRIRQAIDNGKLGRTTLGECSARIWRSRQYYGSDPWRGTWATEGGGVLMNQAVHAIDQFVWFMGDPVEVSGRWATHVHGEYVDVEDTAVATVLFENGGLGVIHAASTYSRNVGFRVAVHGSSGAHVSVWERVEGQQGVNDIWEIPGEEDERLVWESQESGRSGFPTFHEMQIQDFIHAVRDDRPPAVTGSDARKSLEVILAIYESSRTGQPVRFPMARV